MPQMSLLSNKLLPSIMSPKKESIQFVGGTVLCVEKNYNFYIRAEGKVCKDDILVLAQIFL